MATTQTSLTGKKVLFGITKSNWGGAQTYVFELARAAQESGAEVVVMAGSATGSKGGDSGELFTKLSTAGIRTIPLASIERDIGIASEWKAVKELMSVIKKENPDVLHLNSSKMGLLGACAGRFVGVKKILFTAHGWPYLEQRGIIWKIAIWLACWKTVLLSTSVIVVSDFDLKTAPVLLFRDKLVHIANGMSEFPRKNRSSARAALENRAPGLSSFSTWIGMNAELHPNKGIDTAIQAMAELTQTHPDICLVVCGEGEYRKKLELLAENYGVVSRVFLLGFVENAREHLAAYDVYVMSSRKEGFPMALLEAGIVSLPVIATNVGGIPEIIIDQKTGLWMPRGNTHILAKAISYLLANPSLAKEYGENLHSHILEHFTQERMISETLVQY